MTQGVGLSVGATNVAAVMQGCATATRQSVLTLYRHRRPEVGVPSENPRLDECGLVVTGFVDRAGDPVGIVATDGSFHRGEVLDRRRVARALLHRDRRPGAGVAARCHVPRALARRGRRCTAPRTDVITRMGDRSKTVDPDL